MSRYIDADALKEHKFPIGSGDYSKGWNDAIDAICENEPTIDIVRCKECKHNPKGIGWVSCPMTGANTRKPDDFCSYGEREGE